MRTPERYKVFAELKRGSVTTIFKAIDLRREQVVLIKRLELNANQQWRSLFLQESTLSKRMSHPNLRRTYDTGNEDGKPFLVLEYVEGPTLAELLHRHKRLPIDLCLYIAKELAKAVAAVHQQQVLHRDIKPHNIFLSDNGAVKLGDLAHAQEFNDASVLMSGTPAYMSPEQVLGREITEASDLFAVGAVLYEMLTGVVAFHNRTVAATLHHVANWEPLSVTTLRPETPAELVEICNRLLAKFPSHRYTNAEAVIARLEMLEHLYELHTSKHDLAEFIESPASYRVIEWKKTAKAAPPAPAFVSRRARAQHWAITAVISATMFLAGVLFIRIVKEYVEQNTSSQKTAGFLAAPLKQIPAASFVGYLEIQVKPAGVIHVDSDSVGMAPLAYPLELLAGEHEVRVQHPQHGERILRVKVNAGDTLRQRIDFSGPD